MTYIEDWQEALDYCREKRYYATVTSLSEAGPHPDVDYKKMLNDWKSEDSDNVNNTTTTKPDNSSQS